SLILVARPIPTPVIGVDPPSPRVRRPVLIPCHRRYPNAAPTGGMTPLPVRLQGIVKLYGNRDIGSKGFGGPDRGQRYHCQDKAGDKPRRTGGGGELHDSHVFT